jgi:hypothetical protein
MIHWMTDWLTNQVQASDWGQEFQLLLWNVKRERERFLSRRQKPTTRLYSNSDAGIIIIIIIIIIIWFVRLLALRPLLAYYASLGW